MTFVPTTRENKVRGGQKYVGECPQESKVNQVGEEANSHHQHWESLKKIEAEQHTCRKLEYTQKSLFMPALSFQSGENFVRKQNWQWTQHAYHYHVFYYSTSGDCVFFYEFCQVIKASSWGTRSRKKKCELWDSGEKIIKLTLTRLLNTGEINLEATEKCKPPEKKIQTLYAL